MQAGAQCVCGIVTLWFMLSGLVLHGCGAGEYTPTPQQQVLERCAPVRLHLTSTCTSCWLMSAASPWLLLLQSITGSKMEKVCDMCHITLNKNAVVGDVSAMTPGGCRIGTPAMTSRGLAEKVRLSAPMHAFT